MPRRASDRYPDEQRPCSFCRTLRVLIAFALLAVSLLFLTDNLSWAEDIQFIDIFAYAVGLFFVLVFSYKAWEEYGRPKQEREVARQERREAMEKLFDEMDEAVAEREAEEASMQTVDLQAGDELVATVTMEGHGEEPADSLGSDLRSDPLVEEAEIIEEVFDGEEADINQEADLENEDELRSGSDQRSDPQNQPEQLDIFGFELERK